MFCDMRGFTKMSEKMEPTELQELLNAVFSRLDRPDPRQPRNHRQVHGRLRHGLLGRAGGHPESRRNWP